MLTLLSCLTFTHCTRTCIFTISLINDLFFISCPFCPLIFNFFPCIFFIFCSFCLLCPFCAHICFVPFVSFFYLFVPFLSLLSLCFFSFLVKGQTGLCELGPWWVNFGPDPDFSTYLILDRIDQIWSVLGPGPGFQP